MKWSWLDDRPLVVVIAGPNGAGKTTFYQSHVAPAALRFINVDRLANELDVDAYEAARIADSLRRELVRQGESFAFETVFSDPVGDEVSFLEETVAAGYSVAVCFIGLTDALLSEERVAMRVSQGGHDVPGEKLKARYPRTLANLKLSIQRLPHVLVYDNSDLAQPYRLVATWENGQVQDQADPFPNWLSDLI